jgi:glycosyltransferase involved in cell wall biosynthesis
MQQQTLSIIQVTDQLNVGGAEQVIVMLANLLQSHGNQSAVVTTVAPGPLASKLRASVQLINLQRRWKWNPVTMYRLIKLLKTFDVVHVHSSYNLRYVYLASRLFFLRMPIFYHEHYGDININAAVAWHQRLIYPHVIFIAVSKQLATWAIDNIKLAPQRLFLLQNTITKQAVKLINLPSFQYRLLLVSNIRRTKNIEFAIEILKTLNTAKVAHYLTVAGQINDINYYGELKQLISEYSLGEFINFIHDCNEVQPLLNRGKK